MKYYAIDTCNLTKGIVKAEILNPESTETALKPTIFEFIGFDDEDLIMKYISGPKDYIMNDDGNCLFKSKSKWYSSK